MPVRTTFLVVIVCLLAVVSARAAEAPDASSGSTNRVILHKLGKNKDVPDAKNIAGPCVFELAGKRVATLEELKRAIATLPRGTEVYWDSGCIDYDTLPIQGPKTTIAEFKVYCAANGITFTHVVTGF
jgi:hypothetical protein